MTSEGNSVVEPQAGDRDQEGNGAGKNDFAQILEFVINESRYALDLLLVREIFEVVPITPIPRSPPYISGVINMRGEITYILDIHSLIKTIPSPDSETKNIIVFIPAAANGTNVGIIVDQVTNVATVPASEIERRTDGMKGSGENYIKGIIRMSEGEGADATTRLVIWLDFARMLNEISQLGR